MIKQISTSICLFFALTIQYAQAQNVEKTDSSSLSEKFRELKSPIPELKDIEIIQMLQLWDVNTFQNPGNNTQNRNDLNIRRGRIGVKGTIRKNLSYYVLFAYDGIGRDKNTAGNGSPNATDNHDFYLWDAMWTWNPKPLFNVTAGYFRPQVGRENISSAFNVISMDKSLPNYQPRTFLVGRTTGRETGINIGGLHRGMGWSFNYNVGAFDMTSPTIIGTGSQWSPMFTSRVAFTIGDPEMDKYKLNYVQSYYGRRKGITFAANGTYQGQTEIFTDNSFYGGDILANYNHWDFVLEYDWLYRNSILTTGTHKSTDQVYSVKVAYNFVQKNGRIIQPSFMYSGQTASSYGGKDYINSLTGATTQTIYDIGINYLINKDKLKLNAHYIWGEQKNITDSPSLSYAIVGFQYIF
ncbi:MAG TPA: porin [Cytophagaceae bacterium]|jgi:hypothetical protein|nr:porin [Cytophagaceae bacterium]